MQEPTKSSAGTQPDVRAKESTNPPAAAAAAAAPAKEENGRSIQEKIEEAMQPAFDELGGWCSMRFVMLIL